MDTNRKPPAKVAANNRMSSLIGLARTGCGGAMNGARLPKRRAR